VAEEPKGTVLFSEDQRFTQWWVWLILAFDMGLFAYADFKQLILGQPFGSNPASDPSLIAMSIIFGLGLPALLFFARLQTRVATDGFYYRFLPFHVGFRHIPLEEIKSFEAVTYRPLRHYGGYGIRYGMGGRAYNVKGNRGVRIELAGGEKILFGSQRAEALAQALGEAKGQKEN